MLNPGTKLGPYEIIVPAGVGGMGEVYRARDTRLGREVAVKVLPETFACDRDRLRRFEQEARTVAALNHPNILAVYDIGEHQGSPYMVSELLEGETLREKMNAGAMAQRRALEYASQMTEGLAAAHDKGVVHRDLKPENVFVAKDGRVKVLDFGLAKLRVQSSSIAAVGQDFHATSTGLGAAPAAEGLTAGVCVTTTTPGMVLGTAGYMSPEQVRGQEVDARTDIFAFGAILYEMLSGQRAFKAETSIETMNAILKEEPPELETEKLKVSPGLERIVRRCLEKEPARRFHSARDVGFALEAISGSWSSSAIRPLPAMVQGSRRPWTAIAVIALVLAAALAAYFAGQRNAPAVSPSYQQLTFEPGWAGPARFTRDGNTVVYSAAWNGGAIQLYSQRVNSTQPQDLKVDANVLGIADNGDMAVILKHHYRASWLARGTLARLPLEGGTPRPILDDVYAADISRDGKDFAVVRSSGGKQRLEFPIGKVLFETPGWITHVRIAADERRVAFIEHPLVPDDRGNVAMVDLASNYTRVTPIYSSCQGLAWTPDGKELWYGASREGEDNAIFAADLSGRTRTVLRSPGTVIIEDIASSGKVLVSSIHFEVELGVKRSHEKMARNFNAGTLANLAAVSSDGEWLVFNLSAGDDYRTYLRNTNGAPAILLGDGYGAGITPDARMVPAMRFSRPHSMVLYPTGIGEQREFDLGKLQAAFSSNENGVSFSRDGRWALFGAINQTGELRDYLLDMKNGSFRPVTPAGSKGGQISPDGTRVATYNLAAQRPVVVEISSGKASDITSIEANDAVLGWSSDGRSVLVWNQELPARISQVDVTSGRRQLVQVVEPFAMLGSMYARMAVSGDGKLAAYRQRRGLYAIYIADGLK
jgi:eukaryotic-like serine/threonine-protein kinase